MLCENFYVMGKVLSGELWTGLVASPVTIRSKTHRYSVSGGGGEVLFLLSCLP